MFVMLKKEEKLVSSPLDGAAGIEIFRYLIEAGFCLELFLHFFLKDCFLIKYFPKAVILAKMFFFFSLKWIGKMLKRQAVSMGRRYGRSKAYAFRMDDFNSSSCLFCCIPHLFKWRLCVTFIHCYHVDGDATVLKKFSVKKYLILKSPSELDWPLQH